MPYLWLKLLTMKIIGRHIEIKELQRICHSDRPEFLAVYGRRRVGKTYLIKEFFGQQFDFYMTGTANSTMKIQLKNFYNRLLHYGAEGANVQMPKDWFDAFELLQQLLDSLDKKEKLVVFLDELPWFDTHKSNFIQALEYFWNSYASTKNIALIVCGSAASWMIHRLIRNRGGLHNRLTSKLKLEPFNLYECEAFFKAKEGAYVKYEIVQLYMALGGIPFYLDMVDTRQSAAQNIQSLCFNSNGRLSTEFEDLYYSLFKNADSHLAIIRALSTARKGLTRGELIKLSKLPNAGSTTRLLNELAESDFVKDYLPFGGKNQNRLFQLVDFFSLFYLNFMDGKKRLIKSDWILAVDDPSKRAWSGYAFEMLCLQHANQIKKALGIAGVQTLLSSWTGSYEKKGCQIDLIIDRRDDVINLCEIKFSNKMFTITKKYADELMNKVELFRSVSGTKKSIFMTFITPFGLIHNPYARTLVQNSLTLEDLFMD
jgi:AAA+ ATPase superfamily predicted ATPase